MLEHDPLFKHGPDEHGLVSLWQDEPVLYSLHEQMYCCLFERTQIPWLEQLPRHADKSPVYACNMSFNWPPVVFWLKEGNVELKTYTVGEKLEDKPDRVVVIAAAFEKFFGVIESVAVSVVGSVPVELTI